MSSAGPLDKVHLQICAAAALVMTAVCLVISAPLYKAAVCVSLTIVAFYFIGWGVRVFLMKKVFPQPEAPADTDFDDEQPEEAEGEAEGGPAEEGEAGGDAKDDADETAIAPEDALLD
jgi:hypothetical protein